MFKADESDVIVIGAGHAGCEAALSSARLGLKTILFALNLDQIALLACNPSIGGTSKGHLVREIDALGGEMGKIADRSLLQSKMLNKRKGPAVHSLRNQTDKMQYGAEMRKVLENTDNLRLIQAEIQEICVQNQQVTGVIDDAKAFYSAKAVIVCVGTFLNSRCLYGETIHDSGPCGMRNTKQLKQSLEKAGIQFFRFKTGTPARIDKRSLDFSKMQIQHGDQTIIPFSFDHVNQEFNINQVPCYLAYTNAKTHEIIRKNFHRSPMQTGVIEGTATRYCPSIEDKISRFPDKERHQTFIEPEGLYTNEVYIQGLSTALPYDVQIEMYRSIEGFEKCEIVRPAYAIEYDCINATQLKLSLESKQIAGLFFAGQFNGSSGYEEAAAQGLMAGINAVHAILKKEAFVLDRAEAYIGVLIDDLVTKGTKEPYRMMTSRSEYRLLLRQDNADLRLREKGYQIGLINEKQYQHLQQKKQAIVTEIERIHHVFLAPSKQLNFLLEQHASSPCLDGIALTDLMKRPELNYELLKEVDERRPNLEKEVQEQVNIQIKYAGYIEKQKEQVEQFKKWEYKQLDETIDYSKINNLRKEAQMKLNEQKPISLGQASRMTGVSPADIQVLHIYLEQQKRKKAYDNQQNEPVKGIK